MSLPADLLAKYPSLRKLEEQGDDYVEWDDGREEALLQYIKQNSDRLNLKGNPDAILQAIDDFASQQDFLISVGPDKARILKDLVSKQKPRTVVELGGYLGYSAILFAQCLRDASSGNEKPHVWSLEFKPEFAAIATELVALAGLSEFVTFVTGPADSSLRKLAASKQITKIDFLFLDHDENLYEQDLKVCEELGVLKTGACIVADNVVRPGAPKYREYVRGHPSLESSGVAGLIMPGEFEASGLPASCFLTCSADCKQDELEISTLV